MKIVMWICWKRIYVIYEICPSREYFNLVLFNIIVEHDYILTTRNKKDKKFTFIPLERRDFSQIVSWGSAVQAPLWWRRDLEPTV